MIDVNIFRNMLNIENTCIKNNKSIIKFVDSIAIIKSSLYICA